MNFRMGQSHPLQYKICSWRQLPDCLSNTSKDLKLFVTNFINNRLLEGFRIQVNHPIYGTLFACTLNAHGTLICHPDGMLVDFTTSQILAELKKFGFDIVYEPGHEMSGNQIQYLMDLKDLGFDKVRVLTVHDTAESGKSKAVNYVVGFIANEHIQWMNNDYTADVTTFEKALVKGTAINLTEISKRREFDWSWLTGFVANIEDVLAEAAEVNLCQ